MSEKEVFFAGANTKNGFYGLYSELFGGRDITRRYLIKGGPGSGKSTLMRRVAQACESEGHEVCRYACSSDSSSLDAVLIDSKIVLLDATAPHSLECALPGCVDRIVELGAFWDADGLEGEKERISDLCQKKNEYYSAAYRFLSAAGELDARSREIGAAYLQRTKLEKYVARLCGKIKSDGEFVPKTAIRSSIGMNGAHTLEGYESRALTVYSIEDFYKTGSLLLAELINEARLRKNRIQVSFMPLDIRLPDAVLFCESGILFKLADGGDGEHKKGTHVIRMSRFVDISQRGKSEEFRKRASAHKREFCANERLLAGVMQSALDALAQAGEYHFQLENVYRNHINFAQLDDYTQKLIQEVLAAVKP